MCQSTKLGWGVCLQQVQYLRVEQPGSLIYYYDRKIILRCFVKTTEGLKPSNIVWAAPLFIMCKLELWETRIQLLFSVR